MDPNVLMSPALQSAMAQRLQAQEEANVQRAIKESLSLSAEVVRKRRESKETIERRLLKLNRIREYTEPHGDCQLIAMCRSLGFPDESHRDLCREVANFLRRHQSDFEAFHTEGTFDKSCGGVPLNASRCYRE